MQPLEGSSGKWTQIIYIRKVEIPKSDSTTVQVEVLKSNNCWGQICICEMIYTVRTQFADCHS